MPSAPPSSRETSLIAEATPCFSRGQRGDDRGGGGRPRERHPGAEGEQAGEEVPVGAAGAECVEKTMKAGCHQAEPDRAGDADADVCGDPGCEA